MRKISALAILDAHAAQLGQLGHGLAMARLRDVKKALQDLLEADRAMDRAEQELTYLAQVQSVSDTTWWFIAHKDISAALVRARAWRAECLARCVG